MIANFDELTKVMKTITDVCEGNNMSVPEQIQFLDLLCRIIGATALAMNEQYLEEMGEENDATN